MYVFIYMCIYHNESVLATENSGLMKIVLPQFVDKTTPPENINSKTVQVMNKIQS